jgi:hypothetical protein
LGFGVWGSGFRVQGVPRPSLASTGMDSSLRRGESSWPETRHRRTRRGVKSERMCIESGVGSLVSRLRWYGSRIGDPGFRV